MHGKSTGNRGHNLKRSAQERKQACGNKVPSKGSKKFAVLRPRGPRRLRQWQESGVPAQRLQKPATGDGGRGAMGCLGGLWKATGSFPKWGGKPPDFVQKSYITTWYLYKNKKPKAHFLALSRFQPLNHPKLPHMCCLKWVIKCFAAMDTVTGHPQGKWRMRKTGYRERGSSPSPPAEVTGELGLRTSALRITLLSALL